MQELSLNVLDVAENSVRAGPTLIEITVEEDTAADLLAITISDNGKGMTEEQVRQVTDPFFTTRTTRRVGLGVPFFKMAAELSGGGPQIRSQPGKGTVVTARFGLGSTDRMPLGDMEGTIRTLVQGSPGIDFVYTRRLDGRELRMDTREFRRVLGEGIPLDDPQVLGFLEEYLRENTRELLHPGTETAEEERA